MSDDLLTRYVESEDRGERSVLFLRLYAAKIREGTELTWEIPNARASTVEQVADYLAEAQATITALSQENQTLKETKK